MGWLRGFTRYQQVLLGVFALLWVLLAINPTSRAIWVLENVLVAVFVPLGVLSARYFKLSSFSYTLIALFLILHTVGAHYQYTEVPVGYTVGDWVGDARNHYDRVVHFAFGLLLSYPVREVVLRIADTRGVWGYALPLTAVFGLSALFEILEWGIVAAAGAEADAAYLGEQGDRWDAQKDMALAGLGALITMVLVALVNWRYDPEFGRELRESLRVKDKKPLGEQRLFDLLKRDGQERSATRTPAKPASRATTKDG